jgi:predicted DsbA family dithiol-disulfide isomerase
MRPLTIEIYSDITCPWCLIGNRRLDDVLATLDIAADPILVHRPFLLNPDVLPEGINLAEHLGAKYRRDPQEMFRVVETAADLSGIDLELARQPMTYPTVAAHTLLRHAEPKGTGRALLTAFFDAYFVAARNIADVDVLAEVAEAHGFTADAARGITSDASELALTRREAEQAIMRGIRSVPHFVLGETVSISGAQAPETFESAIHQALAV